NNLVGGIDSLADFFLQQAVKRKGVIPFFYGYSIIDFIPEITKKVTDGGNEQGQPHTILAHPIVFPFFAFANIFHHAQHDIYSFHHGSGFLAFLHLKWHYLVFKGFT
ncbi:hypothetical protein ACJX0J_024846, partial [Zea mays]